MSAVFELRFIKKIVIEHNVNALASTVVDLGTVACRGERPPLKTLKKQTLTTN
jgi:hypothetical protein